MRMKDYCHSEIVWRLQGRITGQEVDIVFTDEFEHNQLTGRVLRHRVTWQAEKGGLPFNSSRAAWSAAQAQSDIGDFIQRSLDELSFSEDESEEIYRDPTDPTKFFQKPDDGANDMIQYALVVAFLYLIFQAYMAINQI